MGKLRIQPKHFHLNPGEYRRFWETLTQAKANQAQNRVFFDVEPDEDPAYIRKALRLVAKKEGIKLVIRSSQDSNSLELRFPQSKRRPLAYNECGPLILKVLAQTGQPMTRGEILTASGVPGKLWLKLSNELVEKGLLIRRGARIKTRYSLPKPN